MIWVQSLGWAQLFQGHCFASFQSQKARSEVWGYCDGVKEQDHSLCGLLLPLSGMGRLSQRPELDTGVLGSPDG